MALINCPECQKQISDKAPVCPHCGCPATHFADYWEKEEEAKKQAEIDAAKKQEEKEKRNVIKEAEKDQLQKEGTLKKLILNCWVAMFFGIIFVNSIALIGHALFWIGLGFYFNYGAELDSVRKKKSGTWLRVIKVMIPCLIVLGSLISPPSATFKAPSKQESAQEFDASGDSGLTRRQKDLYAQCYGKMTRVHKENGLHDRNRPLSIEIKQKVCRNAATSTTGDGCAWIDTC